MGKPITRDGYSDKHTLACERLLVTLLRGLGPWKKSVFLVGGLVPRYIVPATRPDGPVHAGTQDVDVVIEQQILAETDAYRTLEENLKRLGFERAENDRLQKLSWRWQAQTEHGTLFLELLADVPALAGGKVQPLPTDGRISALNIPHSSIVFDLYSVIEVKAELLGGNGVATETVRYANIVSFTCLKVLAFEDRFERKDVHDLVYCIEHAPEGLDVVANSFRIARKGTHGTVIQQALGGLRRHFASDPETEGFRKDGPVAVAKFEFGDAEEPELRERRILRQRDVADLIERLLTQIG